MDWYPGQSRSLDREEIVYATLDADERRAMKVISTPWAIIPDGTSCLCQSEKRLGSR
jgi:hypothetical protein